jgi:hypothetical protein
MASKWEVEYSFGAAYGVPYGARGLATLARKIRSDSATRLMFGGYYTGGNGANIMQGSNWLAYACAETALLPTNYSGCTCPAS